MTEQVIPQSILDLMPEISDIATVLRAVPGIGSVHEMEYLALDIADAESLLLPDGKKLETDRGNWFIKFTGLNQSFDAPRDEGVLIWRYRIRGVYPASDDDYSVLKFDALTKAVGRALAAVPRYGGMAYSDLLLPETFTGGMSIFGLAHMADYSLSLRDDLC